MKSHLDQIGSILSEGLFSNMFAVYVHLYMIRHSSWAARHYSAHFFSSLSIDSYFHLKNLFCEKVLWTVWSFSWCYFFRRTKFSVLDSYSCYLISFDSNLLLRKLYLSPSLCIRDIIVVVVVVVAYKSVSI